MDSACPKEHVTEFLSDSDHSTKVATTTFIEISSQSFQWSALEKESCVGLEFLNWGFFWPRNGSKVWRVPPLLNPLVIFSVEPRVNIQMNAASEALVLKRSPEWRESLLWNFGSSAITTAWQLFLWFLSMYKAAEPIVETIQDNVACTDYAAFSHSASEMTKPSGFRDKDNRFLPRSSSWNQCTS